MYVCDRECLGKRPLLEKVKSTTHEIKLPKPFRRVGQIHNRIVREIGAVSQAQLLQPRKLIDAPVLEPVVGDGRAACEVNLLEPRRSVHGQMCHRPVRHVLAVRQRDAFQVRTADDSAWGCLHDRLLVLLMLVLMLVLLL